MPGMTDRDHFAAAALAGLVAQGDDPVLSQQCEYAYRIADAMLRERAKTNHDAAPAARASLPTADHAVCRGRKSGCGTGGQPAIDRLREWERHGSGRWGLGAAGDVTMIERRLAMLEAVHGAAPAARVPEPEPSAARRRPAGGTGGTDHGASPEARASVESVAPQPTTRGESDRNDKAAPRPSEGTGDTPATHATPGEGSERRECTEPVAWGVANGSRVLATSISRMDAVDMQGDYAYHTEIVPLYREPTLTDAEAETLRELRDEAAQYADEIGLCASEVRGRQRIIDGLLDRLGGER